MLIGLANYFGAGYGSLPLSASALSAIGAGLRFRPVELTVKDTLAWYQEQLKQETGRVHLAFTPGQEAKLLKVWKKSQAVQAPLLQPAVKPGQRS